MRAFIAMLMLAVLSVGGVASAALIQIDVNNAGEAPVTGVWNTIDAPGGTTSDLLDYDGETTAVSVTFDGNFNDSSSNAPSNAWNASSPSGGVYFNAARDYFFINSDGGTGTITLGGLNDAIPYNIEIIASYNNAAAMGDFKVNGSFGDNSSPENGENYEMLADGYSDATGGIVMHWTNASSTSGQIAITVTDASSTSNLVMINAIRITEVPEPTVLCLLGAGGIFTVIRRRRWKS